MFSKLRLSALTLLVSVAALGLAGPTPAGAALRYPDIIALAPSDVTLQQLFNENGQRLWYVRFTTKIANRGPGPLELHADPVLSLETPEEGLSRAGQRIYGDIPGEFHDEPVGTFVFHPTHGHFHFDDHARFELWSRAGFEKARKRAYQRGQPLRTHAKVSFCIYDVEPFDASASPVGVYQTCTPILEGLSVGWADVYDWTLADQWVEIGPDILADGDYVIRNVADPSNLLWESDGKADPTRESEVANTGFTYFSVVNGAVVQGG